MEKWISVKEKLPEENTRVIGAFPSKDKNAVDGTLVTQLEFKRGIFFNSYRTIKSVTHWQPLPKFNKNLIK